MAASSRLLTALDGAELRRLEPHVYHLILTARPGPRAATVLDRAVEEDARYAMLVEPLAGMRGLASVPMRRACHVSIVSRSPLLAGVARADGNVAAFAGEQRGDRASDSPRAAGDDRTLAAQLEVHGRPLLGAAQP